MHEKPDGAQLLELARQTLLNRISAELSEEGRYAARLVANAMAIATREIEAGEQPSRAELGAMQRLFGEDREARPQLAAAETLGEALQRLRWRLAAEIRAGERDGDAGVHALLCEAADGRLLIVNPRAVEK